MNIPTAGPNPAGNEAETEDLESMQLDYPSSLNSAIVETEVEIQSDGLLLYVAEACYEPGTSPLSAWVPISTEVPRGMPTSSASDAVAQQSSPLAVFERYSDSSAAALRRR